MMNNIKTFIDKIQNARAIAISGHKNLDGDALCSALALKKLIELNFGKESTVIYDGNIPKFLDEIPLRKTVVYYEKVPENSQFDLYILVDYGTRIHIGGAETFVNKADFIIEFDHHINEDPIGGLCFDDATKAATAQIIYDFVKQAGFKIDQEMIDLLTVGMITDTGHFKFIRNSDVFLDAARLVDDGADMSKLSDLLNNKDRKTVLVESKAAANAEFFMNNRLVIATITRADYSKLDGRGELVLSMLGQIHGVEYVVLLKEQKENQIGISLRSKQLPINSIAESLGGGGHLYAAGAVVQDSLENVREKILDAFKGF